MNYAQIRRDIFELNKRITASRRQKMKLEKELSDISDERKTAQSNYQLTYSKKSQLSKEKYVAKLLAPLESKKSQINEELIRLKSEYDKNFAGLTEDNLMQGCSDKQSILADVKSATDNIERVIVSILGERFYNELVKLMKTAPTIIEDVNRLQDIIQYFNDYEEQITKIAKRSGKVTGFIRQIQQAIIGINVDDKMTESHADIVIMVVVLILTVILFKVAYPVYFMALIIAFGLNLFKHYKIFKIILVVKAIEDNVNNIESLLRKQVLEDLEQQQNDLKEQFNTKKCELEQKLERVELEIQKAAASADSSFVFDDSEVQKDYDLALRQKDLREASINQEISKIVNSLEQDTRLLNEKQEILNNELKTVQSEYLNPETIGDSYRFDTKFIQDVQDSKIDFFTHPQESSLFLYTDENDVVAFTRLLLFQLRAKLNPFAYTVSVFDPIKVGRDYLKFKPLNPENLIAIENLFAIYTEENVFMDKIKEYTEEMKLRNAVVLREHKNIEEYNEFMLSIESLTESYRFIFLLNPSMSLLNNAALQQQLVVGGDVGIYYHVFYNKDSFYNAKESALSAMAGIQKFYVLERTGAKSRAADWLQEEIEAVKDRRNISTPNLEPQTKQQQAQQPKITPGKSAVASKAGQKPNLIAGSSNPKSRTTLESKSNSSQSNTSATLRNGGGRIIKPEF